MRNITILLLMLVATLGPSLVIAIIGFASVKSLGRNPAAAPKILMSMVLAFLFAWSIAIVAVLVVFLLFKG